MQREKGNFGEIVFTRVNQKTNAGNTSCRDLYSTYNIYQHEQSGARNKFKLETEH